MRNLIPDWATQEISFKGNFHTYLGVSQIGWYEGDRLIVIDNYKDKSNKWEKLGWDVRELSINLENE